MHNIANQVHDDGNVDDRFLKRLNKKLKKEGKTQLIKEKFETDRHVKSVVAKTNNQKKLLKFLASMDQVIALGPAGTGKTFTVCGHGAKAFREGCFTKIVITRPTVSTGRSIGFFPGTLEDKMIPWCSPMLNVLGNFLGRGVLDICLKNGSIEIVPFEVMRGRSFENAFVFCDEAQNATLEELKCLVTRVGEDSQLVLSGDVSQNDLGSSEGLSKLVSIANRNRVSVGVVEFGLEDIVRSGICKEWVVAFEKDKYLTN